MIARRILADLSGSVSRYHVRHTLSGFRIEEFLKALSPKKVAEGAMDFSSSLSARGKTANEVSRTANGETSLRGENLTLDGVDLDRMVSRYEASQNFNHFQTYTDSQGRRKGTECSYSIGRSGIGALETFAVPALKERRWRTAGGDEKCSGP